jgi:hypothetical protein
VNDRSVSVPSSRTNRRTWFPTHRAFRGVSKARAADGDRLPVRYSSRARRTPSSRTPALSGTAAESKPRALPAWFTMVRRLHLTRRTTGQFGSGTSVARSARMLTPLSSRRRWRARPNGVGRGSATSPQAAIRMAGGVGGTWRARGTPTRRSHLRPSGYKSISGSATTSLRSNSGRQTPSMDPRHPTAGSTRRCTRWRNSCRRRASRSTPATEPASASHPRSASKWPTIPSLMRSRRSWIEPGIRRQARPTSVRNSISMLRAGTSG